MNSEEIKNEEVESEVTEEQPTVEAAPVVEAAEPEETRTVEQMLKDEQEKYLRLYSEFENFRRRTAKERMELFLTAGKDIIASVLPVLDDLDRALKNSEGLKESHSAVFEGFELIHKKMAGILESKGLKVMDSVGQIFDAEIHEAVTKIPAPSDGLKGKVVDEVEKGYMLNEKVIRFAKVIVGE